MREGRSRTIRESTFHISLNTVPCIFEEEDGGKFRNLPYQFVKTLLLKPSDRSLEEFGTKEQGLEERKSQ